MPGPGGGGGGGRGGSFGGGGHGGGGFGGGPRGGHHGGPRPMHGGWGFWGPRRHYWGGGGCFGGLFGLILVPIIILIVVIALIFSFFGGLNEYSYNEETFQDYAYEQYYQAFGYSDDEDCLLLVVLVDGTDYCTFCDLPFYGYHIDSQIRNEIDQFNQLLLRNVNETNYKYTLGNDLTTVINTLTESVTALELESSYTCGKDYSDNMTAYLDNRTEFLTGTAALDEAVQAFAEATGIPTVLIVEDISDVFSTRTSLTAAVAVVAIVVVAVVAIIVIRKKKNNPTT